MNCDLCKNVKLSHLARVKIEQDLLSTTDSNSKNMATDLTELPIHAGALCLYSALLITKIYETCPEDIQTEDNSRELAIQRHLKSPPKYARLTDEQIASKANEMIVRDIRNCFAHGNFEISSTNNTLYFVLHPQRKGLNIDIPITISKDCIKDAIIKSGLDFFIANQNTLENKVTDDLSNLLKLVLLPSQMLKIGDYYLENSAVNQHFSVNPKRHLLVKYLLLVAQITYEQDDYYNMFGKDSAVFEKISLIRNSIAHNCYLFTEQAKAINYTDRTRTLDESLNKSVVYLSSVNMLKNTIMAATNKGYSQTAVQELKDKLTETLQLYFDTLNETTELSKQEM